MEFLWSVVLVIIIVAMYCLVQYIKAIRKGGFLYIDVKHNVSDKRIYVGPFKTEGEREKWLIDFNAPKAHATRELKDSYNYVFEISNRPVSFLHVDFNAVELILPWALATRILRSYTNEMVDKIASEAS